MLDTVWQDVRFALRLLRKSPLFAATAALSLAIGIGANTAIFSVANALLLRPLPGLASPERLVDLGRNIKGRGFDSVSHPYFRAIRERTTTLDGVYAARLEPNAMSLGSAGDVERVYGTLVSGNYFDVLGTRPAAGRLLSDQDDVTPGAHPVAVISHALWERRFGADPGIAGRTILLNGQQYSVVGVAPPGFQGTTVLKPDVWVPLSMVAQATTGKVDMLTEPRIVWLFMGGRLKPGVTIHQAQAELNAVTAALAREVPDAYADRGVTIAASALVPGRINIIAGFIAILMGIVGLVLLIACVNVAGMMLARAAGRRREIAVRIAIGAGRRRLVGQLLTEAVVLFGVGGVAGVILSRWLTAGLLNLLPQLPVPLSLEIGTDWRVIAFAAGLSLATAVLSGLAPALQASRADLVPALKSEGLDGGPSRMRLRNAFVVGQVTMSLLLVIAAGLFLRSLQHAANVPAGFDHQRVDVVTLDLSVAGYTEDTAQPFVREVLRRLRAMPGIESASASVDLPLDGGRLSLGTLRVPGIELSPGQSTLFADWSVVEPGTFEVLKMRLVAGRDFTEADTGSAPRVAIINETLAARFWPDGDALGRTLVADNPVERNVELRVVGIAADAKLISLSAAAEPFIYVPLAQRHMQGVSLLVRRTGDASAIPAVRALLREMEPNLPISAALTLEDVTALGLIPQRIAAWVAGTLGIVGLVLAAIGIYGVTAYAVSRRTREIGIRIALGADASSVRALVLRQGLKLAGLGVGLGVLLAAAGSRLLESLLVGITGFDPVTFAGAGLLFAAITLIASYIPARRATRVDPIGALRQE